MALSINVLFVFSLLMLMFSLYFVNFENNITGSNEKSVHTIKKINNVLEAMLSTEKQFPAGELRVAVGYGACQDLFVKGEAVLGIMDPPEQTNHYGRIDTLTQLKEMYALFFSSGSAAERYVSNQTLFKELISMAEKTAGSYYRLGGNAPVIASRFAKEGAKVLLAARRDPSLMAQILPQITVTGSVENDKATDDVHLILEYVTGETWGAFRSPRANRFIVHSDANNPSISTAEEFGKDLLDFNSQLLVVSGLQMMDNFPFPPGLREQRLIAVKKQMMSQSDDVRVHFEMASFTDTELLDDLLTHIVPYADSLGMNEQELPNLYSMMKFKNISVVSDYNPRVAAVLDQMREVFRVLSNAEDRYQGIADGRVLTRLHVHTLAFQAIMIKTSSSWKLNKAAATKAALTANRHVCNNSEINVEHANIIMDEGFTLSEAEGAGRIMFSESDPVSCWTEDNNTIEICIAPMLVCTTAKQTAGGGDNISAAGLVLQI